jgi:peptidoglycan hydrolase-like protein with peptidoglycan-binding domain
MANPNQPTIAVGAQGDAVKRLQRGLRRTPDPSVIVDGVFGPQTQAKVKDFQSGSGLTADGTVGPQTWAALPDGRPMPVLQEGSRGAAVKSLQDVLTTGAPGEWNTKPGGSDGDFGPKTKKSVEAFQKWAEVKADGILGDSSWGASLHAAGATLESQVGLQFVVGS